MKYYRLTTCPPIVGANSTYIFKFDESNSNDLEEELNDICHSKTVEDYESYGIEPKDDDDFELEYDYAREEITEEEFKEELEDGAEEISF